MLLRHAIGHVLRRLRLERGLTLRRLAAESAVSLPYLSEIERGRKEASSEILATVCRVLDVSLAALLAEAAVVLGAADDARTRTAARADVIDLTTRHAPAAPGSAAPARASAVLLAA